MDDLAIGMIVLACVLGVLVIVLTVVVVRMITRNSRTPKPLARVDLKKYTGKWYEIARVPIIFENGCKRVTADYSVQGESDSPNFHIKVDNKCYNDKQGKIGDQSTFRQSIGKAVPNRLATTFKGNNGELFISPAALRVSFFRPFYGNYEIYDLGPVNANSQYETAAVGGPGLFSSSLWILSREPTIDKSVYDGILGRLKARKVPGVSRLRTTMEDSVRFS